MIANYSVNHVYSPAERFFVEKMLELVYHKTLDSHRVKLNNPKWSLLEVNLVLKDWNAKKIKNFDRTVKPVIHEALQLIKNDTTLLFSQVDKSYFLSLLNKTTDKEYLQLFHASSLIIQSNKNYQGRIFDLIETEILRIKPIRPFDIDELDKLSQLCDYLATELVNHGYSKGFLYSEISWLFDDATAKSFPDAYSHLKSLSQRVQEDYRVVFRLKKTGGKARDIDLKTELVLSKEQIRDYMAINAKSASFFNVQGVNVYYIGVNAKGWDYLSVIEKAKKELFTIMDLLHLGYPHNPFDFHKKCLVIGSRRRELTNIQPVSYLPDGHYKNNQQFYETLYEIIDRLSSKKDIQKESLQKIVSAFRHLRLGRDADELEQRFINYWIGLEYIFSNYDINDNTITRLKEYFIHTHSTAYIKRNLIEFCQDIIRLKLNETIPDFDLNLRFLTTPSAFDFIIASYTESHPLLSFRAKKYKEYVTDPNSVRKAIQKHKDNLQWHLTRCYRIRNEIVHDAAIHLNIESITGNLKYYLTFILNGLIYYLDDAPVDINMNGTLSIEDYFLLQEIRYNSLENTNFDLEHLINEKSATEMFQ